MIRININEFENHLSKYLDILARGETILICKRNIPIAEIRPLSQERTNPRPIGLAKGTFKIPAAFFDPLPDDLITAFGG